MKKLLSIILTLLMVVNLGVFTTVGAEETNPALEFKGNANALLEIAVKHAQTTGTFANSTIALTQGQSITYTINSDEATPVKFWWNNHATFDGTQTYDLTINGEKVVTGGTLTHSSQSNAVAFTNSDTANTFNFVEGENTFVFTLTGGSVEKINALYIADAEYTVAATGATEVNALSNVSNWTLSEYTLGDGDNFFRVWKVTGNDGKNRSPKFNINVEEAGIYNIYLPSQMNASGVHEFNWAVTVEPAGANTTYTSNFTSVAEDGVYKAVAVPLSQGVNTIRLEWAGSLEFGPQASSVGVSGKKFKTFTIEKAPDAELKCNSAEITELGAEYATTTGTKASNIISVASGQSITYTFKSEEATDARLWWNSTATVSGVKFDLSVNGTTQLTNATLSSSGTVSIGKVSLAQGENTVVFTVNEGTLSNVSKLYITDAEIKLSTKERTNIHALSTTDGLTSEMRINSTSDAYMEVRYKNNLQGLNRTPKYYLDVEETGDYDIYLPSEGTTFVWEIWVNEEPASWSADSATYIDTTVEEEGLYKAFTVRLNEGENYIVIAWNHDNTSGSGSFNKFTGLAIEKTKAPAVNFTGNAEGLTGFSVKDTLTTGTRFYGNEKVSILAGQYVNYRIISNEATPVRLWWNNNASIPEPTTYDLIVNGEKVVAGATLTMSGYGTTQIGPGAVNFVEGENEVVFEVVTGKVTELSKLYIADVEYIVGATESTVIPTMASVTSGYAVHENITAEGVGYREFVKRQGHTAPQHPVYELNVTETGDYDVYLPTSLNADTGENEFKWTVRIDPDVAGFDNGVAYTIDTTFAEAGTYKAVTIPLIEGKNTIRLEWQGTKGIRSSAFNTFSIAKAPVVELETVATVTGTANDGLSVSINAANLVGTDVLAAVAVYEVKDGSKRLAVLDFDVVTVAEDAITLSTSAVAAEECYTYEYKVIVWNAGTLAPFDVTVN